MIDALRQWARGHTERSRYSPVGIAFHWIMAILVMFQIGWGYYTSWLPAGGDKLRSYEVHSMIGLPILLLAFARFGWRLMIPGPVNDADRQGLQTQIAYMMHYVFYIAFFGLPLSGWAMWSSIAEPGPLYLAGLVPWPQLPFDQLPLTMRWQVMDIAEDVHHILVIALLLIIPLHVGAALKHHFWDRHDVLRGMLPEIPDAEDPRGGEPRRPRDPAIPDEKVPG
ncbi:MAG: cytochrome b/b6 domain-containing protein [Sphingobium sp.]|uniref:cytochrome b n=1 Tax=Sphingobium sp. TaxID=1912891 RepID=UPI0029B0C018|nr:cytochrome b/b6 domain-containing protein [Sphingobium sp.]MDX3910164.1 cytochrome b/b6 domain-containing protein [Sphingobium sp.]